MVATGSTRKKVNWRADVVKRLKRYWQLYLLVLPPIVTTFIWHYIPLYGVVIAFKDNGGNTMFIKAYDVSV